MSSVRNIYQIWTRFSGWAKMNRKLFLKSPRFVPFGGNLAELESKFDIRGLQLYLRLISWHRLLNGSIHLLYIHTSTGLCYVLKKRNAHKESWSFRVKCFENLSDNWRQQTPWLAGMSKLAPSEIESQMEQILYF